MDHDDVNALFMRCYARKMYVIWKRNSESNGHPGTRINTFYKYHYITASYTTINPFSYLIPVTVGLTI